VTCFTLLHDQIHAVTICCSPLTQVQFYSITSNDLQTPRCRSFPLFFACVGSDFYRSLCEPNIKYFLNTVEQTARIRDFFLYFNETNQDR
jgi:hypothetical protein